LILAIVLAGCNRKHSEDASLVEAYAPAEGAVGFDIHTAGGDNSQSWIAIHTAEGKTAKFRIELGQATASDAKNAKDLRFSFGVGRFASEAGSDPTEFLAELKRALEAKSLPNKKAEKIPSVKFDFVVLGQNQSRGSDGGFSDHPRGNWTATKIFLANGQAEVFFNFNPQLGKAEFAIKDSDYGDAVLAELVKVL
jgi:hypothetical protein